MRDNIQGTVARNYIDAFQLPKNLQKSLKRREFNWLNSVNPLSSNIFTNKCFNLISIHFLKKQLREFVSGSKFWFPSWGIFPYKRLTGMYRWMGSHFHGWIDSNAVALSIELLEWGRTFSDFWG